MPRWEAGKAQAHDQGHTHDHGYILNHTHGVGHDRDHTHAYYGYEYDDVPDGGLHRHGPFGQPHSHLPSHGEEVTLRGLLTLGVSGGMLPCPSALVVLLSAIALHRVGFGLLLIVAFSIGLAGVLTGIGLLLAYARRLADRLPVDGGAVRVLPLISACAVALMGIAVTLQSLVSGGIVRIG